MVLSDFYTEFGQFNNLNKVQVLRKSYSNSVIFYKVLWNIITTSYINTHTVFLSILIYILIFSTLCILIKKRLVLKNVDNFY